MPAYLRVPRCGLAARGMILVLEAVKRLLSNSIQLVALTRRTGCVNGFRTTCVDDLRRSARTKVFFGRLGRHTNKVQTRMDHRHHIVVVEDEAVQRHLLVDYLTRQNFRVSGADGGTALRKLVEREMPSLVLLDIGLPGEDGLALARWLREKSGRIGIIMVTVASDTVDRVVGLETGADDYIAKPFEPRELLARVRSVLRRTTRAIATTGSRVRMGRRVSGRGRG